MSKFLKCETISKILDIGLLPTFYNRDIETAKKIIQACEEGGAKVVEFTNRGDFAYRVFGELADWCNSRFPDVIIGIGTIMESATAGLYINNGAKFVVGPIFNLEIAKICNRRSIPYIPGCATPSEISKAHEAGATLIKVFPASSLGTNFIRSMLGPFPQVKLMPSGGVKVTRQDVLAWIKAGASALNIGSQLIRKDLVKSEDFESIKKMTKECISWIKEAKEITS